MSTSASGTVRAKRGAAVGTEPEPVNPVVRTSADLAARAALVLRTDSWLSRLAELGPDTRITILASSGDELLRVGFINGDVATKLYNDLRPPALSQFPPRQFCNSQKKQHEPELTGIGRKY